MHIPARLQMGLADGIWDWVGGGGYVALSRHKSNCSSMRILILISSSEHIVNPHKNHV